MLLIRWKGWFRISIPRKWEAAAARESPRNVPFTPCIQDLQSKKFTWKKLCSHHPLQASVKHTALCLQSSTALQGCVRAVLPGYSQQAQNTLLQSSSERYQITQCHCLSFHFLVSWSPFYRNFVSLVMAYLKRFEICCSPKRSAFGIPSTLSSYEQCMFDASHCSKCARTQVATVWQWPSDQLV